MNDTIRCPECSNELKQGYIFSPRRISWSESADSIIADIGNEVLIDTGMFTINKISAHRCEQCKLVIFRHG